MDLEEWALMHAAEIVENVERHGISITWSEAHRRLIQCAAMIDAPVYVEQPDAAPYLLERVDPTPPWQYPCFAEEVARGAVHYAGKRYVPREPDTSPVGVALPWAVAAETAHRLSFVLTLRLRAAPSNTDSVDLSGLASVLVRLCSDVSSELRWTGDDDLVADEKVDGRRYLLVPSVDIRRAARYLRESEPMITRAGSEATADLDHGLEEFLTDPESLHDLLWELDWWTGPRG